jgi:hypothetical protein
MRIQCASEMVLRQMVCLCAFSITSRHRISPCFVHVHQFSEESKLSGRVCVELSRINLWRNASNGGRCKLCVCTTASELNDFEWSSESAECSIILINC